MNNALIYNAVLSGVAGATQNLRHGQSGTAVYDEFGARAAILALAVDALIPAESISESEAQLMGQITSGLDLNRCFIGVSPDYGSIAADIVALWAEMKGRLLPSSSNGYIVVDTYNELYSLTGTDFTSAYIRGTKSIGDGGQGLFLNEPVGSYVEDHGTCAVVGTRAWVRSGRDIGPVILEWYGLTNVDDNEAVIRGMAYSVGSTYAQWIAGEGDHVMNPSHIARPCKYTKPFTLTSTIELRYRGVHLMGPTSYGEGFSTPTNVITIKHAGEGFKLWTGPNGGEIYCPSLALTGVIINRHSTFVGSAGNGLLIDGFTWYRGLQITDSYILAHSNGIKLGATYQANNNQLAGLVIHESAVSNNSQYGIDTGTTVALDLSDIRDIGLNHNTIGPCRMLMAGGTIERVDIEGGGAGGYIVARGARIGHFYVEQTGPQTDTAIKLYTLDSEIQPSICSDSRPSVYFAQYSTRSRIFDRKPVRVEMVTHCDIPSGWLVNNLNLAAMSLSSATHACERAPYLCKLRRIPGASSYLIYTDPAQHTSSRSFDGFALPAAEVGTPAVPDNALQFNIPCTITAGHAYMVAYAIQWPNTPTNAISSCTITNIGQTAITECTRIPSNGSAQAVMIFRASANAASLECFIWPYSNGGADTGYGAAISPIAVIDLGSITSVDQLHIPSLIDGLNDTAVRAGFYGETKTPVALTLDTSTTVLEEKITGRAPSSQFSCVIGYRATLWADADLTKCGSIDETVCAHVATDANSVATVTLLGSHTPDLSKLPATLLGATSAITTTGGGTVINIAVTRPTGLACHSTSRIWIDRFEKISP
jgi:hypothetical protein